jgi:hypothetical protein
MHPVHEAEREPQRVAVPAAVKREVVEYREGVGPEVAALLFTAAQAGALGEGVHQRGGGRAVSPAYLESSEPV